VSGLRARRRPVAGLALAVGGLTALLLLAGLGSAAAQGHRITVTPDTDLDPAGHQVTVRGEGYDTSKGIYVAWCVVPPPGQVPSPCGGGQDQSGQSGSSVWISSTPPPYGVGLARPYGLGGTFEVQIEVARYIGEIDCLATACAVVTRNDHTRTDDRSQDAFHQVSFRTAAPSGTSDPQPTAGPDPAPAAPAPAPAPPPPPAPGPAPAPAPAPATAADADPDADPTGAGGSTGTTATLPRGGTAATPTTTPTATPTPTTPTAGSTGVPLASTATSGPAGSPAAAPAGDHQPPTPEPAGLVLAERDAGTPSGVGRGPAIGTATAVLAAVAVALVRRRRDLP
jgi:hypothetical protein